MSPPCPSSPQTQQRVVYVQYGSMFTLRRPLFRPTPVSQGPHRGFDLAAHLQRYPKHTSQEVAGQNTCLRLHVPGDRSVAKAFLKFYLDGRPVPQNLTRQQRQQLEEAAGLLNLPMPAYEAREVASLSPHEVLGCLNVPFLGDGSMFASFPQSAPPRPAPSRPQGALREQQDGCELDPHLGTVIFEVVVVGVAIGLGVWRVWKWLR